jgi:phage repressor protein C with HTH and peptisase S24 domain
LDISERIKLVRGAHSQDEFARRLEIHKSSLGRYERGETTPDSNVLQRLCFVFGINPIWLLTGEGLMTGGLAPDRKGFPPDEKPGEYPPRDETGTEMLFVPLVEARLSAGHGSLETSAAIQRQYSFRASFLRRRGNPAHMVMVRVSGDSMAPKIENRDVVLIDQSQRDLRPGHIYAVGVEDMLYLKMVDAKPGQVILSSFNKEYEPLIIDTRDDNESGIRIIGRAIWTCRELT